MSEAAPVSLVDDVRGILRQARGKAYATVNTTMVEAYWSIGQRIVEEEQGGSARADYGSHLISQPGAGPGRRIRQGHLCCQPLEFQAILPDISRCRKTLRTA